MDDATSLLPWLALNRLPGVGPVTQQQLLDACGGMQGLLAANLATTREWLDADNAAHWLDFCLGTPGNPLQEQALRDLDNTLACGARILHREDPDYPALLLQIHAAPALFYFKGDMASLYLPQLAIVGSRHASPGGLDMAREFAGALCRNGLAITSGLALGIDGSAHQGALAADGVTLAVIATGLDQIYPARHKRLASEIVDHGGCIVSEFAPGTPPVAQNFPRRNRLISGLSLGVLVVEAGLQSGSLITARYAMEQGREVFALPGSIRSVYHRGCHQLIRQGAKLVESTSDILEELGGLLAFKQQENATVAALTQVSPAVSPETLRLFRQIDDNPVSLDTLCERSQLSAAEVSAALLELEMAGAVSQQHGLYSRS